MIGILLIHMPLGVGQIRQNGYVRLELVSEPQTESWRQAHRAQARESAGRLVVDQLHGAQPRQSERLQSLGSAGRTEWSYEHLLPYFKRTGVMARWEGAASGPPMVRWESPTPAAATRSGGRCWRRRGPPATRIFDDLNGPEPNGFGLAQSAIDHGRRASAASAYLRPARGRQQPHVSTRSLCTRVLVRGARRPSGVQYDTAGRGDEVRARREVILTGGAFNSPQLLMLSGIGDTDALKKIGITPVQHLPGVGCNLQDHLVDPV